MPLLWTSHVCFQMRPILYMVTFATSGYGICNESDFLASTSNRLEFQRSFENNGLPRSYWGLAHRSQVSLKTLWGDVDEINITSWGYINPAFSLNSISILTDSVQAMTMQRTGVLPQAQPVALDTWVVTFTNIYSQFKSFTWECL